MPVLQLEDAWAKAHTLHAKSVRMKHTSSSTNSCLQPKLELFVISTHSWRTIPSAKHMCVLGCSKIRGNHAKRTLLACQQYHSTSNEPYWKRWKHLRANCYQTTHQIGVYVSVATFMTDVFQKNGFMVSIKLLKP